jgi:hypothetical protein
MGHAIPEGQRRESSARCLRITVVRSQALSDISRYRSLYYVNTRAYQNAQRLTVFRGFNRLRILYPRLNEARPAPYRRAAPPCHPAPIRANLLPICVGVFVGRRDPRLDLSGEPPTRCPGATYAPKHYDELKASESMRQEGISNRRGIAVKVLIWTHFVASTRS